MQLERLSAKLVVPKILLPMLLRCFGSASSDRMPLPVWSSVIEVHAVAAKGGRQLVLIATSWLRAIAMKSVGLEVVGVFRKWRQEVDGRLVFATSLTSVSTCCDTVRARLEESGCAGLWRQEEEGGLVHEGRALGG